MVLRYCVGFIGSRMGFVKMIMFGCKIIYLNIRRIIPSDFRGIFDAKKILSRDRDIRRNKFLFQIIPTIVHYPSIRFVHYIHKSLGMIRRRFGIVTTFLLFQSSTIHSLPNFFKSFDRQAYESFLNKDFHKSREILEKQLVDDPDNLLLNYNIGNVYYRQGNLDLAKESFKRSSENSENKNNKLFELSKFNLGDCFYHTALSILDDDWENKDIEDEKINAALQEAESSLECFKKILEINPKNDHAPINKKVVEELIEKLKKKQQQQNQQNQNKQDKDQKDKDDPGSTEATSGKQEEKEKQQQQEQGKKDKEEKQSQNDQNKTKQSESQKQKQEKQETFEKKKMEAMLKKLDQDEKGIQKKMMMANLKNMKSPDNKYQKPW